MKTPKYNTLLSVLVILLISCTGNHGKQRNVILEEEQNSSIYTFSSSGFYNLEMNLKKKFLIDTTYTYKGINYHSFNLKENTISLIMKNEKNNRWESFEFKINNENAPKEIKRGVKANFDIVDSEIRYILIREDGNILYGLQNKKSIIEYYQAEKINNALLNDIDIVSVTNKQGQSQNDTYNEPTLDDFEYSDYWRKEAYKAAKKYIVQSIRKKFPECKVTAQGLYQPYLVRYLGGFTFSVKIYSEFDCNKNYNNPSNFWVEIYYQGNNTWSGEIVEQRFVD
jgi:hypothetical protein